MSARRWTITGGALSVIALAAPAAVSSVAATETTTVPSKMISTPSTTVAGGAGATPTTEVSSPPSSPGPTPTTSVSGPTDGKLTLTQVFTSEFALQHSRSDGKNIVAVVGNLENKPRLIKLDVTGKQIGELPLGANYVEAVLRIGDADFVAATSYTDVAKCELWKLDPAALKLGEPMLFVEGGYSGCGPMAQEDGKPGKVYTLQVDRKSGDVDELSAAKLIVLDTATGKATSTDFLSIIPAGYRPGGLVVFNGTAYVTLSPPYEGSSTNNGSVPATTKPSAPRIAKLVRIAEDGKHVIADISENAYVAVGGGKLIAYGKDDAEIDPATLKLTPLSSPPPPFNSRTFMSGGRRYSGYTNEGKLKVHSDDPKDYSTQADGEIALDLGKDNFGSVDFVDVGGTVYVVVASQRYDQASQKYDQKSYVYKLG